MLWILSQLTDPLTSQACLVARTSVGECPRPRQRWDHRQRRAMQHASPSGPKLVLRAQRASWHILSRARRDPCKFRGPVKGYVRGITESANAAARASQSGERNTHVAEETKLGVREGGDAVDLVLASKRAEPQSVLALLATRHGGGSLQHLYLVCREDMNSILTGRACPKALLAAMGPGED